MVQGKHLQRYNSNTSKEHAYWTSQSDRRIIFRSLEQGNLISASIILQLYVIPTGLLSLIEEPLLGQWSKENTYADTIIIQNSYWISQPDIRTTFGFLKQGKELCHNNSNKSIEHSYWIPQPERSTTFGSLELGHLSSMLILEYYEETKFFWIWIFNQHQAANLQRPLFIFANVT